MKHRCRRPLVVTLIPLLILIGAGFAAAAAAPPLHVTEAVICRDVKDRMPVGAGDVIPAGTARVFCFTRIEGASGATEITHNWYYQGSLKASVVLPVRGRDWRTWSSKRLSPEWKGEWMVEVLSQDETPLDSVVFVVQ